MQRRTGHLKKSITLALQGGGAHGAFAWGVLDQLLADDRLNIEAVSATSAGAMNAVVLAYGHAIGGAEGARTKLTEFWQAISDAGRFFSAMSAFSWEKWLSASGVRADFSPSLFAFQTMTQMFSPYQINPFNINPLRDILERTVDFAHLRASPDAIRLFLGATNVRTGKIRVFENSELTSDMVLASACLPYLFHAVEIAGEHYWDGGFVGNPAIFPLIYREGSRDVVIVHINPLERTEIPRTAPEIFDRMNEVSFNSSLMREMRAIAFVTRLIDEGALDSRKYARMFIHSIRDDETMRELGVATKLDPDWDFLLRLRDAGTRAARVWLDAHHGNVGRASTIDLAGVFL